MERKFIDILKVIKGYPLIRCGDEISQVYCLNSFGTAALRYRYTALETSRPAGCLEDAFDDKNAWSLWTPRIIHINIDLFEFIYCSRI